MGSKLLPGVSHSLQAALFSCKYICGWVWALKKTKTKVCSCVRLVWHRVACFIICCYTSESTHSSREHTYTSLCCARVPVQFFVFISAPVPHLMVSQWQRVCVCDKNCHRVSARARWTECKKVALSVRCSSLRTFGLRFSPGMCNISHGTAAVSIFHRSYSFSSSLYYEFFNNQICDAWKQRLDWPFQLSSC